MEIRVEAVKKHFSFTIQDKKINGVLTSNKEELANIIYLKREGEEDFYIQGERVNKEDIYAYKEKIKIVPMEMDSLQFRYKVYECMYLEIQRNELSLSDPKRKMLDSLKIVGLDITYLNRNIHDLSASEKKLFQLGLTLMTNPEVIILVEPFKNFDMRTERRIASFLKIIQEQYDKTIVIISDDVDMLYQYTENLIIEKNHKIILEGDTKELFQKVDFLKKHGISIPEIVEFTYLVRKKKKKIDYHRDIRDLIKDVYKHV